MALEPAGTIDGPTPTQCHSMLAVDNSQPRTRIGARRRIPITSTAFSPSTSAARIRFCMTGRGDVPCMVQMPARTGRSRAEG